MASQKTIERQQLYNDVWDRPVSTLSNEYGISGSMIARICTKLNVPRPPRGYWAKKATGHKTKRRPRLPQEIVGQLTKWCTDKKNSIPRKGRTMKKPEPTDYNNTPQIPEKEHRMIKATRRALRGEKPDIEGFVSPESSWKHVSLNTSEGQIKRALSLLNTFLYFCEKTGVEVYSPVHNNPKITPEDYGSYTSGAALLRWEDEELKLSIRETKIRSLIESKYRWNSYEYSPSGLLEITVGYIKKRDAKRTKLEAHITEIAQSVIEKMKSNKARQLEWEEKEKRSKFIAKYRHARDSQKHYEEKQHHILLERSSSYKVVTELREYIKMCEQQVVRLRTAGSEITQEELLRIEWMKARLEMIDPFTGVKRPWNVIPLSVAQGLEPERYCW